MLINIPILVSNSPCQKVIYTGNQNQLPFVNIEKIGNKLDRFAYFFHFITEIEGWFMINPKEQRKIRNWFRKLSKNSVLVVCSSHTTDHLVLNKIYFLGEI